MQHYVSIFQRKIGYYDWYNIKRGKVLQQTESHLGIQQYINQRRE